MRPLKGCLGGAIKLLLKIVGAIAMWTIKQTITFIRFAIPHALKLILNSAKEAVGLAVLAVIALFRGLLPTANLITEKWVGDALANGFPSLWERNLRTTFRILAYFAILIGWVILLIAEYFAVDYARNLIFVR